MTVTTGPYPAATPGTVPDFDPEALITVLRGELDYARLRLAVALQSADQAHASLAALMATFTDPDPLPAPSAADPDPIWHALRAPPVQRIGIR
jgi:hypothetical protein